MSMIRTVGFASALLAGTALATPAFAQTTETLPRVQQGEGADNSARELAPGQRQKAGETKARDVAPGQIKAEGEASGAAEAAPGQMKREKETESQASDAAPGQQPDGEDQAVDEGQPSDETTASIDITSEQKTEIRTIVRESRVEPISVDFTVNVGAAIPGTIELYTLPPRFVEIVPQYRGYRYFVLADGRVVIVEPATLKIVYVVVV